MSDAAPMSPRDERLYDLLIARSTLGLSEAEARELSELSRDIPAAELAAMEEAVDALGRAFDAEAYADDSFVEEPMPESLRHALIAAAPSVAPASPSASSSASSSAAPVVGSLTQQPSSRGSLAVESKPDRDAVIAQLRRTSQLGWLAAAASFLIAAGLFIARFSGPLPTPPEPSLQALVDAASDAVHVAFGPASDGVAGSGEVVWSDSLQKGYMKLKGVPANDPSREQYQLWIVDPERAKEPVDGGVFDVALARSDVGNQVDSEVIVPFTPRLSVRDPRAFVITAEQPGGVVVSDGPHLLIAAR